MNGRIALSHTIPICHTLEAEVYLPGPVVIGGGGAQGCIQAGIQGNIQSCCWSSEGSWARGILSQSLLNFSYKSS